MTDHFENATVKTPSGKASGASKAFPANAEPKGKTHFGPQPTPHRPAVENVFNVDKHGKRKPGEK